LSSGRLLDAINAAIQLAEQEDAEASQPGSLEIEVEGGSASATEVHGDALPAAVGSMVIGLRCGP
jgi:hypothetical protein